MYKAQEEFQNVSDLSVLTVNLMDLCENNPKLANDILARGSRYPILFKKEIKCIPCIAYIERPLNSTHINKLVSIRGSVIRAYQVLFKNVTSELTCLKCNDSSFLTEQEILKKKGYMICAACGSMNVRISRDFHGAISSQSIRIQDISSAGAMSETIEILLEGEMAGKFIPGDKVFVTGMVCRRWKQIKPNEQMLSSLCIRALSTSKEDGDKLKFCEIKHLLDDYMKKSPFERRSFMIESFSSEITGVSNVKLGIMLALLGGGDFSSRSNIHVLLVGDPGTAKSHLLKIASKLTSPAVLTNGVGTSDAGLTSCAIRQGKDWSLEAGALVLADMGICCIDEFHRLKVNEKSGLLEAMEQQTISVAKAGMVTSLNTRCSVFAAATTRCSYDAKKTVSENLHLSTPLVSRFDLIFGLFDRRNKDLDRAMADVILDRDTARKHNECQRWSHLTLQLFISQCRKKPNRVPDNLCEIILKYYTKKRKLDGHNEFNTIRMLESLVRLSEAHSKLMNEDAVTEDDVYTALILMETGINGSSAIIISLEKVFDDEEYFNKIKGIFNTTYMLK